MKFDDIRRIIAQLDDDTYFKRALLALVDEASCDVATVGDDLKKFTSQIETWYNNAMERVSGWYIRRTRGFLVAIATVVVVTLNVDTVAICRQLGSNSTLRDSLVESAKRYTTQSTIDAIPPTDSDHSQTLVPGLQNVQAEIGHLTGLGIPLGWKFVPPPDEKTVKEVASTLLSAQIKLTEAEIEFAGVDAHARAMSTDVPMQKNLTKAKIARDQARSAVTEARSAVRKLELRKLPSDDNFCSLLTYDYPFILTKLGGLLLTICAASLGAPFWFDILNRFMSVRGVGKRPDNPKDSKPGPQSQATA